MAIKKQARNEADLEAYLMRELAVLKHYQHENLLQYIGASNAAAAEPGGKARRGRAVLCLVTLWSAPPSEGGRSRARARL